MKRILFVLLACALFAAAADKPIVYNRLTAHESELDLAARKALGEKYTVVDFPDDGDYQPPKLLSGTKPRTATTATGEPLGGKVLVAFVITADGRTADPAALKSANAQLTEAARKAVLEWRFEPAKRKGEKLSTMGAQEFEFEVAPTDFEQQILEPTGGKIQKPKGWFYIEGHRGSVYLWTLSREDSAEGKHYDTGVRLQAFMKVKEGAGKTAKEFIMDFVEGKKKTADRVVKTCEPADQGLFTRICLETEEGPHHILYSLFWGSKDLDIAVVSISGTPKELWDTYAPAFDKMKVFELIDMKRFEKEK